MGLIAAGSWGLLGGVVAALVGLAADIRTSRFRWPWHEDEYGPWPRLCVYGIGIVVGMVVAAAAHAEMTGAWPALLMGIGAPAVVTGAFSKIEVEIEDKPPAIPKTEHQEGEHAGSS
jgi:hypothetical protein